MLSVSTQAKSSAAAPRRKRDNKVSPVEALIFLIPCLQLFRITVVGVLNGTDLILLVIFLYLTLHWRLRIASRAGKWTLALGLLWLASQCVTDIVRRSAFADYARGWSNIGLTLVNLAALWTLLYGKPRRIVIFGWGLIAGGLLYFYLNPSEIMLAEGAGQAWKFAFAGPVSLGVFLIVCTRRFRGHWPITLAVMMGLINMVLGGRSVGGICLAAALYLVLAHYLRSKGEESSGLKAGTVVLLAASILFSLAGIIWAYGYAARTGILGHDARDKYEDESSGKYGVLLGGRTELLASLPAIYDSPILGHGSWARDPIYIVEQHRQLALLGYKSAAALLSLDVLREGLIPAHSYLFQAWVDGGILGAVFWVWVLVLTARAIIRIYPAGLELVPVMAFLGFSLLWNIPFSPFGTQERITFPYTIVLLTTCMDMASRMKVRPVAASDKRVSRSKPKKIA